MNTLTPLELKVVKAMADSSSCDAAATKLGCKTKKVYYHLMTARKKLDVTTNTKLISTCITEGWLK